MHTRNAALLHDYPTLWSNHDVDSLLTLFSDDCCYEDAVLGWVHRGKTEIREFAAAVFSMHPDFRLNYVSSFATDARGAAEWLIEASFEGEFEGVQVARKPVTFRGVTLFEFRDGHICRNTDFWDYADWMRQLGVMTLRSVVKPGVAARQQHVAG